MLNEIIHRIAANDLCEHIMIHHGNVLQVSVKGINFPYIIQGEENAEKFLHDLENLSGLNMTPRGTVSDHAKVNIDNMSIDDLEDFIEQSIEFMNIYHNPNVAANIGYASERLKYLASFDEIQPYDTKMN